MGKLILCSGVRTKRPYGFASTGIRVFSIEELCYYLFHHVYMIEEDIFSDALIDWIGAELKLTDRAEKLRQLKRLQTDVKTMVTVILCSADYYTEYEIKVLLKMLDEIVGMPKIKQSYIKANNCLTDLQYKEAALEYEKILDSKEIADLSPEEYGDVLHNLAITKLHTTGLKEASEMFRQAYERNQKEESLRQYLYALRLSNQEELYHQKVEEYQVSQEFLQSMEEYLKQKQEDAAYSDMMKEIQSLKQEKTQGRMIEYYRRTEELLDQWKQRVRPK